MGDITGDIVGDITRLKSPPPPEGDSHSGHYERMERLYSRSLPQALPKPYPLGAKREGATVFLPLLRTFNDMSSRNTSKRSGRSSVSLLQVIPQAA